MRCLGVEVGAGREEEKGSEAVKREAHGATWVGGPSAALGSHCTITGRPAAVHLVLLVLKKAGFPNSHTVLPLLPE